MKQTPMQCEAKHCYGLISAPQICMTNVNKKINLSTVYPTVSTLFYIVKIIVNRTTCAHHPESQLTCVCTSKDKYACHIMQC